MEADDPHPCAPSRDDARNRIFDHDGIGGINADLTRREQEDIGRRLSARDLRCGVNMRPEKRREAGFLKVGLELWQARRGGHRTVATDRRYRFRCARDRVKLSLKASVNLGIDRFVKSLR